MSALRIVAPIMTAALGIAGLTAVASTATASPSAPAHSASSRVAVDQCLLRLQKTRVLDLQHDGGTDEVFARLGNSQTTSRTYTLPQTRNTTGDGQELFSGFASIVLVEQSGPFGTAIDSKVVACENATRDLVFDDGDARYKVRALVQVQP